MKRTAGAMMLMATLGGCVTTDQGPSVGGMMGGSSYSPPSVPGVQGPWGQPVAMAAPYSYSPPGAKAAQAMMANSVPLEIMQAAAQMNQGGPSGIMQAGGINPMMGMPAQPFVLGQTPPPGAVAAMGANMGGMPGCAPGSGATQRSEVRFAGPSNMKIAWFAPGGESPGGFTGSFLTAPARYNFVQGGIYRLKLSEVPGRPGLELYPTLEVAVSNPKTDAFLAHSAVPVTFTDEDFDQVAAGNYIVKVVYLPDPQYQDLATLGTDEVVSSRLEPGKDPIGEAHRRGSILLVVRMGNINLEAANTPSMTAPSPYGPAGGQGRQCVVPGMPQMGPMAGGMPMMLPGMASGVPGPQAGMPQMPSGVVPAVVAPAKAAAPQLGPISKATDLPAIQQTQYQTAAEKAEKAAQKVIQGTSIATEKKADNAAWWTDSKSAAKK